MPVQTEEEASGQEQIFVEQGEAPGWGQPDGHQVWNEIMVAALVSMLFCMYQPLYRNIFRLRGKEEEKIFVETGQAPDWGRVKAPTFNGANSSGPGLGTPVAPGTTTMFRYVSTSLISLPFRTGTGVPAFRLGG